MPSNPALPLDADVLQVTPGNDLYGFGKHGFDLDQLNRIGGQLWLDHPADKKVLLFFHGCHCCPFAKQQFLGVQGVHQDLVVV